VKSIALLKDTTHSGACGKGRVVPQNRRSKARNCGNLGSNNVHGGIDDHDAEAQTGRHRPQRPSLSADVMIAGAGPTGLMLAAELCLGAVSPLVLERRSHAEDTPRANGLPGQILELLRYRGQLQRLSDAAGHPPHPAAAIPFGGLQVDLSHLADSPLWALGVRQPQLEGVLGERAGELGAVVRRGHEVIGVTQNDTAVTVDVRGPDGPYRVDAGYLVGCDGAHSRVRDLAGISFPGTTFPEINRLGQVALHHSVTRLDNGDLDVPGVGTIRRGFTRTSGGVFGLGSHTDGMLMVQTTEDDPTAPVGDTPLTLTELQDSIRRVLGANIPLGQPLRLSRYRFQARQAQRYRGGRILLAGDAAHQYPATGTGLNSGLLDAVNLGWKLAADLRGWAPDGLLDTYHDERHFAGRRTLLHTQAQVALRRGHDPAADALRELFQELCSDEQPARRLAALVAGADICYPIPNRNQHPSTGAFVPNLTLHTGHGTITVAELMHHARPVLLDLADRPELREIAQDWQPRIDIHTATTDHRPADALLIRPDAHIAWTATIDEPTHSATTALREALNHWFGTPTTMDES
jgi:2-polyprenyl-6-methoxyphenol hydroxylase-like FAD-dependent oxidoreductase